MDPIIPQPEQPQYQAPIEHKHFLNKKFIITFVILLLLGGGAYAGIWYWQKQQVAQEVVPTFTPRASALPDSTADWKTYTNTRYGFELKYLPTLTAFRAVAQDNPLAVKGDEQQFFIIKNSMDISSGISFEINTLGSIQLGTFYKSAKNLDDYLNLLSDKNDKGEIIRRFVRDTKIGGRDAKWYEINEWNTSLQAFVWNPDVYFQNNNDIYNIRVSVTLDPAIRDQILSTFKFTDTAGQFCGGIAGVMCPSGYTCKLEGSYPDAGGTCIQNSNTGTLTGHVTIGPNCPVEKVGNPCTPAPQAYTSRQVMVYKADGATLVTTQNFDTNGDYSIALPAGTYVIKSRTGISSIASVVGTVAIKAGQTTTVNFSIDTGIR